MATKTRTMDQWMKLVDAYVQAQCGLSVYDLAPAAGRVVLTQGIPMNARFWVWENDGWVKLTLRPGQAIEHLTGGRTDEGYCYGATTWTHDGDGVIREWAEQARDCDGRLDSYGEAYCPLADLRAQESHDENHMIPEWQYGERGQRDYAAEAAGY